MCVAVPARIVWIGEASPASIPARVDVAGREQPVDLVLVPAAALGEHVVVHSGYAVRRLSPSDAAAASRMLGLTATGE